MTRPNLQVNLKTFQRKWRIDPTYARKFLARVWAELCTGGKPPAMVRRVLRTSGHVSDAVPVEVSIVLLNDSQMARYNQQYRKKKGTTDVLSFPLMELQYEGKSNAVRQKRPHSGIFCLGDILISMERTASQAIEKNHSVQKEFKILLLHGVLHLLGYDHETDTGQMDRIERKLRKAVL